MRLAVILPNWVGDVVMATPAIRALRELVGPGRFTGIMRPYVADVLSGSPWFDHTILYSKKPPSKQSSGASPNADFSWPIVRQRLQDARLDAIVLLTNSLRTGWMAYRSGATRRIGTSGNFRSLLLTARIREAHALPAIDGYLEVAKAAGAVVASKNLELHTTRADEAAADAVWNRLKLPDEARQIAVLNTGGAFGAAKDWPADHFAALARRLAEDRGLHVLVNCGPAERETARRVAAAAIHPRVLSLADEPDLPIGLAKAVIRRAGLLVTTDSGPRFFGVAFGVPTVALFGPTDPRRTPTFAPHESCISLGLECQPCMQRACPLKHHRCMVDLAVDRVFAAAIAAQDARWNSSAA